ncbi:MAG: hypothetical protein A3J76_03145 [Candidatus Moranbacteria bacterium RBG_13_45_13]|nr:MAG: hypothetical protein A3J76_03145 [Candidatus Moranbacteria bacterium RBG_13_45_13]
MFVKINAMRILSRSLSEVSPNLVILPYLLRAILPSAQSVMMARIANPIIAHEVLMLHEAVPVKE